MGPVQISEYRKTIGEIKDADGKKETDHGRPRADFYSM